MRRPVILRNTDHNHPYGRKKEETKEPIVERKRRSEKGLKLNILRKLRNWKLSQPGLEKSSCRSRRRRGPGAGGDGVHGNRRKKKLMFGRERTQTGDTSREERRSVLVGEDLTEREIMKEPEEQKSDVKKTVDQKWRYTHAELPLKEQQWLTPKYDKFSRIMNPEAKKNSCGYL